jgi:hypothetical protein
VRSSPARRGGRGQAGGQLDDAADGRLAAVVRGHLDQGLTRLDPDPDPGLGVDQLQSGPDRALRVVVMDDGRTEHGHRDAADRRLDRAAEAAHHPFDGGQSGRRPDQRVLRVDAGPGQVGR